MNTGPADYRPRSFKDLIGVSRRIGEMLHEKCARTAGPLKVLLYGAPGTGKTELIKLSAVQLTGLKLNRSGNSFATESVSGKNVNSEMIRRWMEGLAYRPMYRFSVVCINEIDKMHPDSQVLILDYLDAMGEGRAFFATSNLELNQLTERFESRLQQFRVASPTTAEISAFLVSRWAVKKARALEIAIGANGNVRSALMDCQSVLDVERIK